MSYDLQSLEKQEKGSLTLSFRVNYIYFYERKGGIIMLGVLLNWIENEIENIDTGTKHPYLKGILLNGLKSLIDGAIVSYPLLVAILIYLALK